MGQRSVSANQILLRTRWAMEKEAARGCNAEVLEQLWVQKHGLNQLANILHALAYASQAAVPDVWRCHLKDAR